VIIFERDSDKIAAAPDQPTFADGAKLSNDNSKLGGSTLRPLSLI